MFLDGIDEKIQFALHNQLSKSVLTRNKIFSPNLFLLIIQPIFLLHLLPLILVFPLVNLQPHFRTISLPLLLLFLPFPPFSSLILIYQKHFSFLSLLYSSLSNFQKRKIVFSISSLPFKSINNICLSDAILTPLSREN